MSHRRLLVAVVFAGAVSADAALPTQCQGAALSEARSLADLPGGVGALLGVGITGAKGIADRGQKFNCTDLIDPALPRRRLVLAGVSAECVLISVERGGRGHSFSVLAFVKQPNGEWQGVRDHVENEPKTLEELRAKY
jgi:hypothetical protein